MSDCCDDNFVIDTDQVNLNYPGAVFRGTSLNPKKVVMMYSNESGSSGQLLMNLMYGENEDGNLGQFTTGIVLGEITGQIYGGNVPFIYNINPPVGGSQFVDSDGNEARHSRNNWNDQFYIRLSDFGRSLRHL